ncbi:hypothetical protein [Streptomyces jumonjinensis]
MHQVPQCVVDQEDAVDLLLDAGGMPGALLRSAPTTPPTGPGSTTRKS